MPEIQMPKLSDTMTEGTLVAWKKKRGDQVSAGEVLAVTIGSSDAQQQLRTALAMGADRAILIECLAPHIERVATGHYARRQDDPETGRLRLLKGRDGTKDQS